MKARALPLPLFAALLGLVVSGFAVAQSPVRADGSQNNPSSSDQPGQPEAEPLTTTDKQFVDAALALVQKQLAGADLAGSRADSEELREYASGMKDRLGRLLPELEELRSRGNASGSSLDAADNDSELQRLRTASSSDFDPGWISWQGRQYHDSLAVFERAAINSGNTEQVRRLANTVLPWLRDYALRFEDLAVALDPS